VDRCRTIDEKWKLMYESTRETKPWTVFYPEARAAPVDIMYCKWLLMHRSEKGVGRSCSLVSMVACGVFPLSVNRNSFSCVSFAESIACNPRVAFDTRPRFGDSSAYALTKNPQSFSFPCPSTHSQVNLPMRLAYMQRLKTPFHPID